MDKIFFGIVILHVVAGFGWLLYRLEWQKKKPGDQDEKK